MTVSELARRMAGLLCHGNLLAGGLSHHLFFFISPLIFCRVHGHHAEIPGSACPSSHMVHFVPDVDRWKGRDETFRGEGIKLQSFMRQNNDEGNAEEKGRRAVDTSCSCEINDDSSCPSCPDATLLG